MSQSADLDRFLALSFVLTGEKSLDITLAGQYLDKLKEHYSPELGRLLDAFDELANAHDLVEEVKHRIVGNDDFRFLSQQIISIWYTSEFVGPDKKTSFPGTQEQYYSGLLWKVIKAHPPSHSTEQYGYWTTQPE
jgi:hypothetical protein